MVLKYSILKLFFCVSFKEISVCYDHPIKVPDQNQVVLLLAPFRSGIDSYVLQNNLSNFVTSVATVCQPAKGKIQM